MRLHLGSRLNEHVIKRLKGRRSTTILWCVCFNSAQERAQSEKQRERDIHKHFLLLCSLANNFPYSVDSKMLLQLQRKAAVGCRHLYANSRLLAT